MTPLKMWRTLNSRLQTLVICMPQLQPHCYYIDDIGNFILLQHPSTLVQNLICFPFDSVSDLEYLYVGMQDGPNNVVTMEGNNVSLRCRNNVPSMSGLVWSFRSVVSQTVKTLYRNSNIIQYSIRFSVSEDFQIGEIYLNIKETKPEDAGLYNCIISGKDYKAQLVIIGKLRLYSNEWSQPSCDSSRKKFCFSH